MSFRIRGLEGRQFAPLYDKSDADLSAMGIVRTRVTSRPGAPDRVTLTDVEPGQFVLLLNYMHQSANTPYRATHAIYVAEGALTAFDDTDAVPECLRIRTLSVRAFDQQGMMVDADVVEGTQAATVFERLLAAPETAYLQVHYAKRGCYAALITRD